MHQLCRSASELSSCRGARSDLSVRANSWRIVTEAESA